MIDTQLPLAQTAAFDSLDEIQAAALGLLINSGHVVSPRGMDTREVLGVGFCLRNPRRRCVTVPARRWSLPLAIGEFCWHASASDEVSSLEYYSKRWRAFSDDSARIRGSCYGLRVFRRERTGSSQWEHIVDLLHEDRDSRRAVATLANPASVANCTAKDVACATAIQFLVRENKLNAVVNMRSNDVIWGLPYDVFLFTMLQELLAVTLRIELGAYYHFVGSLHLYDRHLELAKRIVADEGLTGFEMPPMRRHDQLGGILSSEEQIRAGTFSASARTLDTYWRDLMDVLSWFAQWRLDASCEFPTEGGNRESPYAALVKNMTDDA